MKTPKTNRIQFLPTALTLVLCSLPLVVQGAQGTSRNLVVNASTSSERESAYQALKAFIQENGKSQSNHAPRLLSQMDEWTRDEQPREEPEDKDVLIDALSDHSGRFARALIREVLELPSEDSQDGPIVIHGLTTEGEKCVLKLNPKDTNAGQTIALSAKSGTLTYSAWAWPEWKFDNYFVNLSVSRLSPDSIRVKSHGEAITRALQWVLQKGTTESTYFDLSVTKSGSVRMEFKGFIGTDEWFSLRSKTLECEFNPSH